MAEDEHDDNRGRCDADLRGVILRVRRLRQSVGGHACRRRGLGPHLCCEEFCSSPDELYSPPGNPLFDIRLRLVRSRLYQNGCLQANTSTEVKQ